MAAILARTTASAPENGGSPERGVFVRAGRIARPGEDRSGIDDMQKIKVVRRAPVWLDSQAPLAEWYSTRLGQSILDDLEAVLAARLDGVFGYQGLQIGNPAPERTLLAPAGLQRLLSIDTPARAVGHADIAADVTALPVATDSVKAVLFFHTLDFCEHPHQALREADRVLTEDGHLLIVGFNPLSTFGLRHLLTGWRGRAPWNARFWSRGRVGEWLSVLDYRVLSSEPFFIRPPVQSERLLRRLRPIENVSPLASTLGGLYVIQARKQTVPLSMSRKQWLGARSGRVGRATGGFAGATGRRVAGVVKLDSARRRDPS